MSFDGIAYSGRQALKVTFIKNEDQADFIKFLKSQM